jgi:drug/metabolite transporter (DMT)-like permease
LVPVVGIALAAIVLGEQPSVVELVAAVVIVGGVMFGTPRPARVTPDEVVGTEEEAPAAAA